MSTGSIQNQPVVALPDQRCEAIQLGFTNDSGSTLVVGQEVYLKTNGKVDKRVDGSTVPLGIVIVGGGTNERVTVRTFFTLSVTGLAKGGSLNPSTPVVHDGTVDTEGRSGFIAAGNSEWYSGVVITGGAQNTEILIGIYDSVLQTPSA